MRAYEAMVIFVATLDDAALEAGVERISQVIAEQGGTLDRVNLWGKRRLAYELDGHDEGVYVVVDFHAEQPAVSELERVLHLNDQVLRHMVVHQEELPPSQGDEAAESEPSAAEPASVPSPAES